MKYNLQPLAGQTIVSAKLRMFVNNGSVGAQNIKAVANNSWTEATLNFTNAPAKGATITTFTPGPGTLVWVDVDLTPTVVAAAGSSLSLALDTASTDGYDFASKDSPSDRVHLEVLLSGTPAPTPVPTPTPTPTPSPTPAPTVSREAR